MGRNQLLKGLLQSDLLEGLFRRELRRRLLLVGSFFRGWLAPLIPQPLLLWWLSCCRLSFGGHDLQKRERVGG